MSFGLSFEKLFVVQTQALPRRRAEVFDQDICGLQQLEQNLPAFFLAQIECDAFLISIERAETWPVTFVFGVAAAMRVASIGQLDFDDLAAQVAEQAAGVRPGDMAANLNANSSFESARNHRICNRF